MIIGNPWGLLGLLAIPAILAIHFFRRTFREQPTSALWLYGPGVQVSAAGRRPERIVNRRSLWLELLAALVLTLWLADLHLDDRQRALHHLWILDSRRSLQATAPDGSSAQERLLDQLRIDLAGLDRDDRVTLLQSGTPPMLLAGPAATAAEAVASLDDWAVDRPWHDLAPTLELAADLARHGAADDGRTGLIRLVSDRAPEGLPQRIGLLTAGLPLANQAIVDARWFAGDAADPAGRVTVRIANFGDAAVTRSCLLQAGGAEQRRTVELAAGGSDLVRFPVPAGVASVTVALEGSDALPVDDRCRLQAPPPRQVRVALGTDLPGAEAWRRLLELLPQVRLVTDPQACDLLITGPAGPLPGPGAWLVRAGPAARPGEPVLGPFLARRGLPLLADCDWNGCLWAGAAPLESVPAGEVVLAAGEQCLISVERVGRQRHVALFLDPERATLFRHPVWPALVQNLLDWRADHLPGPRRRNLPVGQPGLVSLPPGVDRLQLVHGEAAEPLELVADEDGLVLIPGLAQPGGWRLGVAGLPDWERLEVLPVDGRSGDLRNASSGGRPAIGGGDSRVERRRDLLAHLLPLLVGVAAILLTLVSYRREQAGGGSRDD